MRSLFSASMMLGLFMFAPLVSAGSSFPVEVGKSAPDFFLRDMQGVMHKLSDVAFPGKETSWKKKKKVLLDFFRTDCKPCMKELPEVIALHNKYKDRIQVIMVALLEEQSGREKLNQWIEKNKPPFPVLIDAYETVAKKYIVKGDTVSLPSIFLIDENGVIRISLEGLNEDLESELSKALGLAVLRTDPKKK